MAPAALLLPLPVEVVVGVSFLVAGVVAWKRRPENLTGLFMILSGLAWFSRDLARWHAEIPTRIGELSLNVFLALIAHQVIVFPYGVARSRLERALVWSVYVLALGGYVLSEVFPSTNDPLASLAIPLIVAIIFVAVQRWLTATPPERRALEPILWAGPPVLVVAAVSIAHDYLDVGRSSAVDWLKLVYTAIPVAFLVGVLRTKLQRAAVGGIAALVYDSSLLEDPALVRAAGAAARLALENARLQAELRAQLERRRDVEGGQVRLDFVTAPKEHDSLAELTTRELEVLALLAEGRTDRGIGQALYVSPKTVEAHVRSIFRKLDLPADAMENRRVHAVLTFLRARSKPAGAETIGRHARDRPHSPGRTGD